MPLAVPIGLYIGANRTAATSGGLYGTWWVLVTLPLATAGATVTCPRADAVPDILRAAPLATTLTFFLGLMDYHALLAFG